MSGDLGREQRSEHAVHRRKVTITQTKCELIRKHKRHTLATQWGHRGGGRGGGLLQQDCFGSCWEGHVDAKAQQCSCELLVGGSVLLSRRDYCISKGTTSRLGNFGNWRATAACFTAGGCGGIGLITGFSVGSSESCIEMQLREVLIE